ncbi:calcium/sodium antiporter [Halosimplex litoreum]|uniref:Calcium/sodium antiporter n=1 Tax=Halosimplex litoreum TaxID=1198301 RepID=A0A7T3G059_9EURY|nr:calcium/sodium antiporter [Halosimplex litoreum]QPV63842.1 calcium/sodium antiporter [Halosimplex litoreum]
MVTALVDDVLLVAVGVAGLWVGADQFVAGASRLARRLGVSGLVIGLTVVSFGTSAPEFAVTVDAALTGQADISVGNVVGSNVVNLGFVLGGTALVRRLPVDADLVRRDGALMVGTVLVLLVMLRDLTVSRVEGALLVLALGGYLVHLARADGEGLGPESDPEQFRPSDAPRLLGGLAVVVVSAHVLVTGAASVAADLGISEWAIGTTVVALGTSTPELVTSLAAAYRGRANLAAGNVVGSCIFNALGVLGVASVLDPLSVAPAAFTGTLWLLGVSVVTTVLLWSGRALSRPEGAVLVALNALDWVVAFLGR